MKAIRVHEFGPPEVMVLEDVPDPKPGPGQVVIEVKAAGVNPTDAYRRSGAYAIRPALPFTPGLDAAGFVEAVGEGTVAVSQGDRVYTSGSLSGTYAGKALCGEGQVHRLPANVTFSQGAGVYIPYGTAYHALAQVAAAKAGDTVLIRGASGGVGLACVQIARAAGMTVIGTAGSEDGLRLVSEQGAHHVLDHRAADDLVSILALTGGRGVDVVLEMLANVNLEKDLKILTHRGKVVVIGSRGRIEIDPRDIMSHHGAVLGLMLFNASERERLAILAALEAGLENGTLRPVVGKEFPLAQAAKAHHEIMESRAYGKIVLVP